MLNQQVNSDELFDERSKTNSQSGAPPADLISVPGFRNLESWFMKKPGNQRDIRKIQLSNPTQFQATPHRFLTIQAPPGSSAVQLP
jgi:hypothetical protein